MSLRMDDAACSRDSHADRLTLDRRGHGSAHEIGETLMIVLVLLVFISLCFVLGAVMLFAYSVRNRDMTRIDQLSLLPLEDHSHAK